MEPVQKACFNFRVSLDFRHILVYAVSYQFLHLDLVITRILLRVYRVDSQSMCYCQPYTDHTPLIPSTVNPSGDPLYSEENEAKSVGRSSQHR